MKVSVIVPTYNTGAYLDACVESLLGQSLSPGEHEIIFVDDGSSDGTAERLVELSTTYAHVRTVVTPNSGGPGRPRNLGIDAARGEYVYFLDDDDWLEPEALERLYGMAMRNDADIVLGKMVGHGRGVPKEIFRENRDRADLLRHHLLTMLTPHKLFRTTFIRDHGIRFPEGSCRLEDHRFVLPAYLNAKVISVLADYVCCHWIKREDNSNYSAQRLDPVGYFADLRAVLDIVDLHTDPGPYRDRLYAHWFRAKMLKRQGGNTFLWYEPDHRREIYEAVRDLTRERFPPRIDRWLPPHMRVRAELVRADAYPDLTLLAEAEQGMTLRPRVQELRRDGDTLVVRVSAVLTYRDGQPVTFRQAGAELRWELPAALRTPVSADARTMTDAFLDSQLDIVVRSRDNRADFFLPVTYGLTETAGISERAQPAGRGTGQRHVELTGEARLDPATAQAGRPLADGVWDYYARISSCGWSVQRRLGPAPATPPYLDDLQRRPGSRPARAATPYWTMNDNLSVRVGPTATRPAARLLDRLGQLGTRAERALRRRTRRR